ncbi:hypothetical protein [Methylobacter sp. sgz302048]|uniref:hypothetical protein n=1 Tax=Methylobacter sp. sgz302048 TaxID=3455945 RepID=UPI003F9EF9A9
MRNEEYLLRIIYAPEHIVNGSVIESAIALDDLSQRGFSLDRETYVDDTVMQQRIITQTNRNPAQRQSNIVAKFQCCRARSILDEMDERVFIVIDDAQDDNKAHASLYSAKENLGRGALRKLRSQLLPLLQENL